MVLTGKYEDIAPMIYNEMVKYGATPAQLAGPKGSLNSTHGGNTETQVDYAEKKVSFCTIGSLPFY